MGVLDLRTADKALHFGFDYEVEPEIRGMADFDGPTVAAARHDPLEVIHYSLSWDDGTPGQAFLLRELYASAGTRKTINFIPAEGADVVEVRFAGPLKIKRKVDVYEISFDLEGTH